MWNRENKIGRGRQFFFCREIIFAPLWMKEKKMSNSTGQGSKAEVIINNVK